jgi:anaerobic selenocysteine-containing dehydrogenase
VIRVRQKNWGWKMNDHQVATATNRIRLIAIETMKGAFGNEGALRFSPAKFHKGFAPNNSLLYCAYIMPATLYPPEIADRLRQARHVQTEIDKLQRKLAALFAGLPKNLLIRNHYGLTAGEMTKIAQKLHARAKEKIAGGRSKEFRGCIEDSL